MLGFTFCTWQTQERNRLRRYTEDTAETTDTSSPAQTNNIQRHLQIQIETEPEDWALTHQCVIFLRSFLRVIHLPKLKDRSGTVYS